MKIMSVVYAIDSCPGFGKNEKNKGLTPYPEHLDVILESAISDSMTTY